MEANGTPAALAPIARQVLDWVASERNLAPYQTEYDNPVDPDVLRRIELCALATLDVGMLHDLYCIGPRPEGDPGAPPTDLQDER